MNRRTTLIILCFTVFLDILGFGIILPHLPLIAQDYGATGAWLGAILTAYSLAQFVGAPVLGRISDRLGRRPIIIGSLIGSALSFTVFGFATNLWMLLASRTVAGLFGGSIAAAQAAVADISSREERSKYMGMVGASIGLGFVFGPALGAAMGASGHALPSFIAAGLALLNAVIAAIKMPETKPQTGASAPQHGQVLSFFREFARSPSKPILASILILMGAFVAMESTFGLIAKQRFDWQARELGWVFTYIGVIVVIVQGGVVGQLAKRVSDRSIAIIGAAAMSLGLILLPFQLHTKALLVALGVLSFGQALVSPSLNSLLSKSTSADRQGSVLGLGQSAGAIARALFPLAAGALYDVNMALPYVLSGVLALLTLPMLFRGALGRAAN